MGDDRLTTNKSLYRFALCPKSAQNVFFDVSRDGCYDRARVLTEDQSNGIEIECIYQGPTVTDSDGILQAEMVQDLLNAHINGTQKLDGFSISIRNGDRMRPVIQRILQQGLPVITFDSDDPSSGRRSYIGTDNYFFGSQLAKVVQQIHPQGGTFAIMTDSAPNIVEREAGVRDTLLAEEPKGLWTEVAMSPFNIQQNSTLAIAQMHDIGSTWYPNITAIIPTMGSPMFQEELWKELIDTYRNIIFVVADGLAVQLSLLGRNYAHGLVAQMPYAMGSMSVDTLLKLAQGDGTTDIPTIQGTNVIEHLQIPLVLPELVVNHNHLHGLRYVGITLFVLISITCLYFAIWVYRNQDRRIVKASQPEFLYMILIGSLLMGSSIIPLGFDDSIISNMTSRQSVIICMATPWLLSSGFVIVFSALFAKTYRVTRLLNSNKRKAFTRIVVSIRQVLIPFFILFTLNLIILICWTLIDPLQYTRQNGVGLDPWNRVLETYGTCTSQHSTMGLPYLIPLAIINVGLLMVSNWQAYQARTISVEFAESNYIGMVVASLLQAGVIGIPVLFLVKDLPEVFYLLMCILVFIICMAVLLLIFVPKVVIFSNMSDESQRRLIRASAGVAAAASAHHHDLRSQYVTSPNDPNTFSHNTAGGGRTGSRGHEDGLDEPSRLVGGMNVRGDTPISIISQYNNVQNSQIQEEDDEAIDDSFNRGDKFEDDDVAAGLPAEENKFEDDDGVAANLPIEEDEYENPQPNNGLSKRQYQVPLKE